MVSKTHAAPREDWSFEELQDEAEALRARLNRFRTSLGRFLVKKQELVDLMVVAAVAQEPLLLVGPPGTAKSDLVLKFKDALGLGEDDYFEYMLTRFTEPSEIIGPIDIGQLREGRYVRREQGKLPTARLAFLDEIFKSNSAILNILLTIINSSTSASSTRTACRCRCGCACCSPRPTRCPSRPSWRRSRTASASRPRAGRCRSSTSPS
jgi:MoxR-like ATPase